MNWINSVIDDFQKKIQKTDDHSAMAAAFSASADDQKTVERIQKFQVRLHDLDKRLLELR